MNRATLSVPDITCSACVETIESLFLSNENVKIRVVLIPEKEATVFYNAEKISLEDIRNQIEDVGFDSKILEQTENIQNGVLEKRTEFVIEGMTCNSCTGLYKNIFKYWMKLFLIIDSLVLFKVVLSAKKVALKN